MPDEIEPINFIWFYFIGKAKLGLTFKETGRLTYAMFMSLYKVYKETWDFEHMLIASQKTYAWAEAKAEQDESWF